jgi:DNA-binding CsgD family transcriptional regulator
MRSNAIDGLSGQASAIRCSPWFSLGFIPALLFPTKELIDALGHLPVGIAICDRCLRFAVVNLKIARMNNVPPEEHLGRYIPDIVGNLGPTVATRLVHVFSTGEPIYNAELVGKLGTNPQEGRWRENYFPIHDRFGRITHAGVFVIPVSGKGARSESSRGLDGDVKSRRVAESVNLAVQLQCSDQMTATGPNLSPRETDILRLLAQGVGTKEAGAKLGISVKTVEAHKSRLMLKIQATSVVELVHYAIGHDLVALKGKP